MSDVSTIRAPVAHLRREPSHASELVSQLVLGEQARVLETRGEWARVIGPDRYEGWIHVGSLVHSPSAPSAAVVWTRRSGLLRETPEPLSTPVCDLVLGARAAAPEAGSVNGGDVTGRAARLADGTEGWAGTDGWVLESELARHFPREGHAVVKTALSLIGVPYLWGGTSTNGFDCSGLVQRVFRLHGVALARDAYQQAQLGRGLERSNGGWRLEPGDLIFFAENGGRVTHVGVATGEGGRFVHSSTSRAGVGIDSLDPGDSSYSARLAEQVTACRRVL